MYRIWVVSKEVYFSFLNEFMLNYLWDEILKIADLLVIVRYYFNFNFIILLHNAASVKLSVERLVRKGSNYLRHEILILKSINFNVDFIILLCHAASVRGDVKK